MLNNKKKPVSNNIYQIDKNDNSVLIEELISIGTDIGDAEIKMLLHSELLQNIPILKCIVSSARISQIFVTRIYLKKLFAFLQSVDCGDVNLKELEKRRKAAVNNESWLIEEVESIISHLQRLDEQKKAQIAAVFYIEYINQNITLDRFEEYLRINEKVFTQDFEQLHELYHSMTQEKIMEEKIQRGEYNFVLAKKITELNCDRLLSVGLVRVERPSTLSRNTITNYELTGLGIKFAEVLIATNNK